jgi:hypothetical protein
MLIELGTLEQRDGSSGPGSFIFQDHAHAGERRHPRQRCCWTWPCV